MSRTSITLVAMRWGIDEVLGGTIGRSQGLVSTVARRALLVATVRLRHVCSAMGLEGQEGRGEGLEVPESQQALEELACAEGHDMCMYSDS